MSASSPEREFAEVSKAAATQAGRAAGGETPCVRLGAHVAGPLAYTFLRWLERTARTEGVTQLWFAAREGELLLKCATEMRCAFDGRYLPVSRQALWRCVYRTPRDEVPFWIIDSDERTIHSTLLNLGWKPDDWAELLDRHGFPRVSWDRRQIWTSEARARLLRFLQEPSVARQLEQEAREQLAAARRCFVERGLIDGSRVGFVDLGWNGTIQGAWQQVLAAAGLSIDVTGCYLALEANPYAVRHRAMEYAPGSAVPYLRAHHTPVECLLPAGHGQLLSYQSGGLEFAPFTTFNAGDTEEIQAGALAFCRIAAQTALAAPPLRPWLKAFLHRPDPALAMALADARFNSGITAGATLVRDLRMRPHVSDLLRSGPCSEWPGGWIARALPGLPGAVRSALSRGCVASVVGRRSVVRLLQRSLPRQEQRTRSGGIA